MNKNGNVNNESIDFEKNEGKSQKSAKFKVALYRPLQIMEVLLFSYCAFLFLQMLLLSNLFFLMCCARVLSK